ncbi:RidA family protein [Nesterenkonia sphaerica]|uniref:RidA family protein n=1 Tax=Nesterenkonia sphaerica TaxID=1804988 RepID=A0A5R9APR6_9MICC|nr:RidA family protein [Nesterenkonia sphaerica]TLP79875.1 RidA family protein [Nesterenkonia sphaerica]
MPRTPVTGNIPVSHLPFSPAVRAGDFIFVSGQASVDDAGAYVADDFAGEMARSMANVERILGAAGATLDDVVQVRSYLGDMAFRDEYNELYPDYFKEPLPARTTTSGGIGSLKYEVDVVAYRPSSS